MVFPSEEEHSCLLSLHKIFYLEAGAAAGNDDTEENEAKPSTEAITSVTKGGIAHLERFDEKPDYVSRRISCLNKDLLSQSKN